MWCSKSRGVVCGQANDSRGHVTLLSTGTAPAVRSSQGGASAPRPARNLSERPVRAGVVDHPGGLTTPARRSRRRPVPGSSPGGRPRRDGSGGPGLLSTRSRWANVRMGLLSTSRTGRQAVGQAARPRGAATMTRPRGVATGSTLGPVVVDVDDGAAGAVRAGWRRSRRGSRSGSAPRARRREGVAAARRPGAGCAARRAGGRPRHSSRWRTSTTTPVVRSPAARSAGRPSRRAGRPPVEREVGAEHVGADALDADAVQVAHGRRRGRRASRSSSTSRRPTAPASRPRWRTGRRTRR